MLEGTLCCVATLRRTTPGQTLATRPGLQKAIGYDHRLSQVRSPFRSGYGIFRLNDKAARMLKEIHMFVKAALSKTEAGNLSARFTFWDFESQIGSGADPLQGEQGRAEVRH